MKENIKPTLPPALRKARPAKELSDAFPPIVARPRPEPPPPALAPAPVVAAEPAPAAPEPVSPPAPPKPSRPTPPIVTAPAAPKTRPKPTFKGRSPIAELDGKVVMFEGSFVSEGNPPFVVETKLTGNGKADKQALINAARQKYPEGPMALKSTRIFSREVGAVSTFKSGCTLGQLFGEGGSETEATVSVGNVFFDGTRCEVMLRNLRSRNCVTFSLRQTTGGSVNFSNQVQSNRLAKELPTIVREILGNGARELQITLKEEKSPA